MAYAALPLPAARGLGGAYRWAVETCGRRNDGLPNGPDAKLQAAFTRERTSGAPLAARKERFCLSDLQAA